MTKSICANSWSSRCIPSDRVGHKRSFDVGLRIVVNPPSVYPCDPQGETPRVNGLVRMRRASGLLPAPVAGVKVIDHHVPKRFSNFVLSDGVKQAGRN